MADVTILHGFLLLLGLSLFLGLAFEEYDSKQNYNRPGGIRTFPFLAFSGAMLYLLEPQHGLLALGGLLVVGAWLHAYYVNRLKQVATIELRSASLIVPSCALLAYALGPITITQNHWLPIAITVTVVLMLTGRDRLHNFAKRISTEEMITLGKFLVLVGIVLPFLPNEPVTHLTNITPYQAWLAVLAVCTLSYGSYIIQKYWAPERGIILTAIFGGFYSSTATTVTLARLMSHVPASAHSARAGIAIATCLMYFRVGVVISVFNWPLAKELWPSFLLLATFCMAAAFFFVRQKPKTAQAGYAPASIASNPLELSTALVFSLLFVLVSVVSGWLQQEWGENGVLALATFVGIADVDPLALSLAQGAAANLPLNIVASAVLLAIFSNNLLKATYCLIFSGRREGLSVACLLSGLAFVGAFIVYLKL